MQQTLFHGDSDVLPMLRSQREVQHQPMRCKTVLNYCNTRRMPEAFTINPYRGCEFGCAYCYARYTHEFLELDWREFETRIFVKLGAERVLLKSLNPGMIGSRPIVIGTATDPYQPAEGHYRVTRRILEVFTHTEGLTISVNTKSSLVKRDIDLFSKISQRNDFRVNISLISMDKRLLRALEPKASAPGARLEALRTLSSAGIQVGIFLMPVVPGLTDSLRSLESVVRASRENGALFLSSNCLFLRESSRPAFSRYLMEHHPGLFFRFRNFFAKGGEVSEDYRRVIATRVRLLKQKYGFAESRKEESYRVEEQVKQLSLL